MSKGLGWMRASGALNGMLAVGVAAIAVCGCATGNTSSVATCLDDSSSCISKRKSTLSSMLADPKRQWVAQKPSPKVYATGVRLFAWRRTQKDLTCSELRAGISETGAARATLSGGGLAGASKTRIGQIIAMSDDLNTELKRTARGKRCPKA